MRLVVLYGPPGVGKLTVGGELATLTGFRLFHNHLTVNLATAIFPWQTPAWDRLVRTLREAVFAEAVQENVDLILTRTPRTAGPREQDRLHALTEPIRAAGGSVMYVHLTCEPAELHRRVQQEGRRAFGKLTDPEMLSQRYVPSATYPFEPHLHVETTHLSAAGTAAQIAAHYALPTLQKTQEQQD